MFILMHKNKHHIHKMYILFDEYMLWSMQIADPFNYEENKSEFTKVLNREI